MDKIQLLHLFGLYRPFLNGPFKCMVYFHNKNMYSTTPRKRKTNNTDDPNFEEARRYLICLLFLKS